LTACIAENIVYGFQPNGFQ